MLTPTHNIVSAKMIRHYETIGLIARPVWQENDYLTYGSDDVHWLRFIRRGRALGNLIATICQLLALWGDTNRPSADVKRIALAHPESMRRKIAELVSMARAIEHLADFCMSDHQRDCPILDDLTSASLLPDDGDRGLSDRRNHCCLRRRAPHPQRDRRTCPYFLELNDDPQHPAPGGIITPSAAVPEHWCTGHVAHDGGAIRRPGSSP
ncbi:MAG: MerR family DNA-binding protein [Rhodospirillales bacterium]|nr:MerR family DNA-binding protein [Rhodospirillales bacterium]